MNDATMLLFMHLCGLRIEEVAALRFDNILDVNGTVHVNGTVRDDITLDTTRTKSKRARKIFLPKQMHCQLRDYTNGITKRL